jgi:hypothetical protein
MPYGTLQADKIQGSINSFSPDSVMFRNRIINGNMAIDQRNAGASVTVSNNGSSFITDRFRGDAPADQSMTFQQQTSVIPTGFSYALKVTAGTATSNTSNQPTLAHFIEGFNFADLGFGTANAKTFTLSFWVRSSLTGTFGVCFENNNADRAYIASYTINVADTFEYKTVTIAGDTSGTWETTNQRGLAIFFDLGYGTTWSAAASSAWANLSNDRGLTGGVKLAANTGATFYITGVQLEVGSTATSFDYRPYGTELALCQRYYETAFPVGTAVSAGATYFWYTNVTSYSSTACRSQWIDFKATKRALPTVTPYRTNIVASNDNSWALYNGSTWYNSSSATNCYSTHHGFYAEVTGSSMSGVGYSYICIGAWVASAEL